MAKAVGIDYGTKRIGISISDSSQIIATSLCAIENKHIFSFLKELLEKEEVDTIVIGEAKNLDTNETDSSKQIYQFVEKLKNQFPKILIKTIDERFTSKIAFQSIIDSGIKKKKRKNKSLIDKVSATIILQDYLTYK
ncbi:MAG: Holliday junction resolvase RuvX [Flavobacteriales bacterium]|nr:Holliday junction resolvase RuvX [Flavobacteriales bacterium]MBT4737988.1 Holliday junction resolvase RuvX [Flavobacteriales bacterium]MBT5354065.1 Holliday junction resolvase RuvX [Flavobacteriales bacterium]MBT6815811.1 Holliday junction resolvase RuvX [Flavobacteriales bacterium]